MDKKVILISIDGMRPDAVQTCGNPFVDELKNRTADRWTLPVCLFGSHYSYTFEIKTTSKPVVFPGPKRVNSC